MTWHRSPRHCGAPVCDLAAGTRPVATLNGTLMARLSCVAQHLVRVVQGQRFAGWEPRPTGHVKAFPDLCGSTWPKAWSSAATGVKVQAGIQNRGKGTPLGPAGATRRCEVTTGIDHRQSAMRARPLALGVEIQLEGHTAWQTDVVSLVVHLPISAHTPRVRFGARLRSTSDQASTPIAWRRGMRGRVQRIRRTLTSSRPSGKSRFTRTPCRRSWRP